MRMQMGQIINDCLLCAKFQCFLPQVLLTSVISVLSFSLSLIFPRFKVHHALHQVMEENRDSLVLIFLEDVADYRLTQSLMLRKGMLKRHCMVQWPLQKERIPAFRQKLQLALASSNRVS